MQTNNHDNKSNNCIDIDQDHDIVRNSYNNHNDPKDRHNVKTNVVDVSFDRFY